MKLPNVEQPSIWYALLRFFPGFVHNWIFYKKVYTQGLENIPEKGAVIFAPNHQNTLMDAVIILSVKNWQPVFMARADIFAGQFIRRLLFFFKILPIFRIRDGKKALQQNEEIFQKSVEVLKNKRFLVIYPEASHEGKRRLRPLKKGISRIAFMAEEATDYTLDVKIVPVGINYQNYFNFRSSVLINFGKPINVEDYRDLYKENPQKANHELITRIAEEIRPLIIDIKDTDFYDNFETARSVFAPYLLKEEHKPINNFKNQVEAGRKVVKMMDDLKTENIEEFLHLNEILKEYGECLKESGLRDWIIRKNMPAWGLILQGLLKLIGFPIYLFGTLNNFFPYFIPSLLTNRIKDKNFHTSVRFVIYLIAFPFVFYPLIFYFVYKFIGPWWLDIIYTVAVPITGIFAHRYFVNFIKWKSAVKYYFNKNKEKSKHIVNLRNEVLNILKNRYKNIK